jgi:ATP-dependent RNA helicase SUPV3L1/SUV3
VTIPAVEGAPKGFYEKVGYRLCGARALRIDMLERLADLIRPMDVRGGFEATPDMMSITGCTLDQLADILQSLGFDGERGERPKPVRTVQSGGADPQAETTGEEQPAGATAKDSTDAAQGPETGGAPAMEPAPEEPAPTEDAAQAAGAAQPVETAGVPDSATGAEAAPPEAAATAAEGDTAEIETFYTFCLRPRHRSGPARKPEISEGRAGRPRKGPARRGAKESAEGEASHGPGHGSGKGKGQRKGPGRDRDDEAAKHRSERPRRVEKPVDPNSPFAVLMQLKNK